MYVLCELRKRISGQKEDTCTEKTNSCIFIKQLPFLGFVSQRLLENTK